MTVAHQQQQQRKAVAIRKLVSTALQQTSIYRQDAKAELAVSGFPQIFSVLHVHFGESPETAFMGSSIALASVKIRCVVGFSTAVGTATDARLILVQWLGRGSFGSVTDILYTASTQSPFNLANRTHYNVLYDAYFAIGNGGGEGLNPIRTIYVPGSKLKGVTFNSSGGSPVISSGQLYLIAFGPNITAYISDVVFNDD